MAGLTLAPEESGSLAKQQLLHKLLQLWPCSHWGYRIRNESWFNRPLHFVCKMHTIQLLPKQLLVICSMVWQATESWTVGCERDSTQIIFASIRICIVQYLQVSAQAWEWHYSLSVHLLRTRTSMAGLTLAPEDSGSLVKPRPVYVLLHLRSCFH